MITKTTVSRYFSYIAKLAEVNGIELEFSHNRRGYKLQIIPTGKVVRAHDFGGTHPGKVKKAVKINLSNCPTCDSLLISNHCIDKTCAYNNKKAMAIEQKEE